MSVYTKVLLSGSTSGRPIKVTPTSSPGETIHTATATATEIDEIWLWAANTSAATVNLSVQWGGTTTPDDYICSAFPIEANSDAVLVAAGLVLTGGLLVKAFASVADVITVFGYVNRITQ